MAEFALAAGILGIIRFTLSLWDDASEVLKSGSTISKADCTRQASSLQTHCDRVKSLQDGEMELEEAERLQAMAVEIRDIAESLATQLAKCELPPGQKGWKRYRDLIPVLWHGLRIDADAQMKKLAALRNELQSEILVSMFRKTNLADLRNSQNFQRLSDDIKALIEAMFEWQGAIEKAIEKLDVSADERHREVLERLDHVALTPPTSDAADAKARQDRIKELSDRLWFDAIPRRHHAIKAAHAKTFEWIFTGQKKTQESNTTLMEWMSTGSGLYWVSGRAGCGKSSLMRFLEDDPRTISAFQEWAGERNLVLATFYFWNSERAGDPILKSLSGLCRGILYGLIQQDDKFADLLFPHHFVAGRRWDNNFPTLLDMTEAFERLLAAKELPAAVGLIIDGLDEYEATSREQMAMAEMLCHASESPHLKIVVSSRPEDAFESVFKTASKLRLHELTVGDRRTYASDTLKLRAGPRFDKIATNAEQAHLIDLVVERSEGIFLWLHLAVETLVQEIGKSMDISRLQLENIVMDIPSGDNELAQVFDHMLRKRIPLETRLLGFRLIRSLLYGYTITDQLMPWVERPRASEGSDHLITAVFLSFFEDDMTTALQRPIEPLDKDTVALRIELTSNLVRRSCAGLLEMGAPSGEDDDVAEARSLIDPEVHFIHKDVALYLHQENTSRFMDTELEPVRASLGSNLLKCIVSMLKLYFHPCSNLDTQFFIPKRMVIWQYVEGAMRIARTAEGDDGRNTELLLDEMDTVMTKHNMGGSLPANYWYNFRTFAAPESVDPLRGLHWTEFFETDPHIERDRPKPGDGHTSTFLSFTIEQSLFRYLESKLHKSGKSIIAKPGRPLLSSACGTKPHFWLLENYIRPQTVKILLEYGADPNEVYKGESCWQVALDSARHSGSSTARELEDLANIMRLLLDAGADPNAELKWTKETRLGRRNYVTETIRRTAEEQIKITFLDRNAETPHYFPRDREASGLVESKKDAEHLAQLGRELLRLLKRKRRPNLFRAPRTYKARMQLLKGRLYKVFSRKKGKEGSGPA
ncbi:small s protein [Apodospora peruviana]|uniref:Small s protein n=1 Tax=Apodospora peruviana TaxID=516989 RepID=A0AAE0HWI2_9PEZI|nr:small s protein [Apodospora peruviana]